MRSLKGAPKNIKRKIKKYEKKSQKYHSLAMKIDLKVAKLVNKYA